MSLHFGVYVALTHYFAPMQSCRLQQTSRSLQCMSVKHFCYGRQWSTCTHTV